MIDNTLQEGTMSFEDLIAESNTLEVEGQEPVEPASSAEDGEQDPVEPQEPLDPIEPQDPVEPQDPIEDPIEPQDPIENPEDPKPQINPSLTSLAKKYLENGKWEDVVLDIDGEEVQLSELSEVDEETFLQIQDAQENLKEEARAEKFIPKEGLNEVSLKIIELQKNGGDITEAIRVYDEYVNPLEKLDLTNEAVQEQLVRKSLSAKVDDPEIVEMTINKYKKDLVLDKKAQEVSENIHNAFNKYIGQKNTEAQEKKKAEQEAHKNYVKSLEDKFKDVELKSDIKKQALTLANKNDKGEYLAIETVKEQLQDPELAQELLLFLGNREAYKKSLGAKVKAQTNMSTMKKVKLIKDKQKKQTSESSKKDDSNSFDFEFIEMNKL
jgi:hypothetical protein